MNHKQETYWRRWWWWCCYFFFFVRLFQFQQQQKNMNLILNNNKPCRINMEWIYLCVYVHFFLFLAHFSFEFLCWTENKNVQIPSTHIHTRACIHLCIRPMNAKKCILNPLNLMIFAAIMRYVNECSISNSIHKCI